MKAGRGPKGWRWIYLSITSNSGKNLWACNRCGLVTPGPTKWEFHRECDPTRQDPFHRREPVVLAPRGDSTIDKILALRAKRPGLGLKEAHDIVRRKVARKRAARRGTR